MVSDYKLADTENAVDFAHIKRFMERLHADPNFRDQLGLNPSQTVAKYKIEVDPEEIRPLWDSEYLKTEKTLSPLLVRFLQFVSRDNSQGETQEESAPINNPHFRAWRQRQIARTASQFPLKHQKNMGHIPAAFELSKGCSVGCWFCSVSAQRLQGIFSYNQDNAKLWRDVLELMKTLIGPAVASSFCYLATDPLDNPDYEHFCADFFDVLGTFPQTVTAQALKDPARTRALLKLSREKGCKFNCFSILSLKMFNQIQEEFTAEELAFVYLILQHDEALLFKKANAGRAREWVEKHRNSQRSQQIAQDATNACVTGFVFNLVDQSVKLISPCNPSELYPSGYITYDEESFSDIDGLKILLENMIEKNMPLTLREDDLIRFRQDLKYESLPDGFKLSTKYKNFKFRNAPYLNQLGDVVSLGDKTTAQIVSYFEKLGTSETLIRHSLNQLFERGLLEEKPKLP